MALWSKNNKVQLSDGSLPKPCQADLCMGLGIDAIPRFFHGFINHFTLLLVKAFCGWKLLVISDLSQGKVLPGRYISDLKD